MTLPWLTLSRGAGLAAAAVTALVALGLIAYGWRASVPPRPPEADPARAAAVASALGGSLGAELDTLRAAVEREDLAGVLARGDPATVRAAEERLAAIHPAVRRVWVLPAGYDRPDYATSPPLTYASLSLLQRSETEGKAPPLEGQLFGSKDQQLVLAVRVADPGGALRGHALFSLDPQIVQGLLDAAPWTEGYAELLQAGAPAGAVVIAQRGQPGGLSVPTGQDVPGTAWRLSYRPPGVEEPTGAAASGVVALWAGSGLLVVLGLAGAARWGTDLRRRAARVARARAAIATPATAPVEGRAARPAYEPEPPPPLPTVVELTGLEQPEETPAATPGPGPEARREGLPDPSIFLPYDIRGVVGETLDPDVAQAIGRAIGSEADDRGQRALVVGRDGRLSSPELSAALIRGLVESGRDVIDVGQVPTPVVYFAAEYLDTHSAVVVTASHNPPEYNGFKVVIDGETLAEAAITRLRRRLETGDLVTGAGSVQSLEMDAEYIRRVTEDIPAALGNPYRLVVDCGNGVAGEIAPRLYRALGHDVVELHCEVDGRFPHHPPDPTRPENLQDLIAAVREEKADLGLALDGDGDRLVVVDAEGEILWPDRLLTLFALEVLPRNPGATVVYDVKCSARLGRVVAKLGGNPVMWKSGHSLMKAKMRETGAILGGEGSGHLYIRDRWYGFDDALYAGARLLDILRQRGPSVAAVFAKLPAEVATPEIRIPMARAEALALLGRLSGDALPGATVSTLDGLRAEYPDGWGLVRVSNTTPELVLRFEGTDEAALQRVQAAFRQALAAVAPGLALPF
jgi:phosphomannomutase/phosphoglucomutase